jgi:hypothetical protein
MANNDLITAFARLYRTASFIAHAIDAQYDIQNRRLRPWRIGPTGHLVAGGRITKSATRTVSPACCGVLVRTDRLCSVEKAAVAREVADHLPRLRMSGLGLE